ncbi:Zinc finger protein [Dirofilaria immitis]
MSLLTQKNFNLDQCCCWTLPSEDGLVLAFYGSNIFKHQLLSPNTEVEELKKRFEMEEAGKDANVLIITDNRITP